MKKYLAKSKLKSVYVENGKATKVFAKTYNKSDVLYEALNTSRVEDAGVNIPKLLEVLLLTVNGLSQVNMLKVLLLHN